MANKIDTKLVTKWLKALRSGEYKQGRLNLKSVYGGNEPIFCCLGVLCDVASNGKCWTKTPDSLGRIALKGPGRVTGRPSAPLRRKVGINQIEGKLIHMNDSQNKSFKQIARFVEQQLFSKKHSK